MGSIMCQRACVNSDRHWAEIIFVVIVVVVFVVFAVVISHAQGPVAC